MSVKLNTVAMARLAICAAAEQAGMHAEFERSTLTRMTVHLSHLRSRTPVTSFSFAVDQGGVVAVRIRRLAAEGVSPMQWIEHMPTVLNLEKYVTWEVGLDASALG